MLEKTIEKAVVDYAKKKGFLSYKWASPSNRGVHDRIFFKSCFVFTIEFKAPGKKPTKLQKRVADELNKQSISTFYVDNIAEGKKIIKDLDDKIDFWRSYFPSLPTPTNF